MELVMGISTSLDSFSFSYHHYTFCYFTYQIEKKGKNNMFGLFLGVLVICASLIVIAETIFILSWIILEILDMWF